MGNYPYKAVESQDPKLLKEIYQQQVTHIKHRLDSLETFTQSLVQSLECQSSIAIGLQGSIKELQSEVANTLEKTAADKKRKIGDRKGNEEPSDHQQVGSQTRSGSARGKSNKRGKQETSVTDEPQVTLEKPSDNIDRSSKEHLQTGKSGGKSTTSREGREIVHSAPGTAVREKAGQDVYLEINEQDKESYDGDENRHDTCPDVSGATAPQQDDKVPDHIMDAFLKNQNSVVLQAVGIHDAVRFLQDLIEKEIPKEPHSEKTARDERKVFQIHIHEAQLRSGSMNLCMENDAQTDMDGKAMEKLMEDNCHLFSLKNSTDRIIRAKEKEIESLKRELAHARSRPSSSSSTAQRWSLRPPKQKVTVQIFCQRRSEKLDEVNRELEGMLKTQLDVMNYDLSCMPCEKKEQLNSSIPIIVLCINASRLGTDVLNSVEGIKVTTEIAVVVLHHKDTHALPRQPSSKVLTGPEYKSLLLIDMAFLSTKGVYPCDMNQNAIAELVSFITSVVTNK